MPDKRMRLNFFLNLCAKTHANVNICSKLASNAIILLFRGFISVKVESLTPVGAG
jgi:hypothetical protein